MTTNHIEANETLDCTGLACPMPIVRTKKAIQNMNSGEVLEVQATDKGSLADLQAWAKSAGHQYLGTVTEGELLKHFVRKASPHDVKQEATYPHTATNEELEARLSGGADDMLLLDVREAAEYAFGHIAGAVSIPLGQLEQRLEELPTDRELFVICRTGSRSDMACNLLAEKGYEKARNVIPGMSGWSGPVEKLN
ncbi:sulfurtransferase TusA family protein [Paenibacillus chungangensis]|uniref:Sulfurtransferase TusA family protein n=1 Tax=Paenibacillus chungangensis TaxID=696535 RepID=A0ABW3HQZ0_9BACL